VIRLLPLWHLATAADTAVRRIESALECVGCGAAVFSASFGLELGL